MTYENWLLSRDVDCSEENTRFVILEMLKRGFSFNYDFIKKDDGFREAAQMAKVDIEAFRKMFNEVVSDAEKESMR